MALDSRNCFWFGTEERMQFFATPLQGADSSPSAWGADGTLLNGGGWALNSWGSHKRYTYEWPASSSRETAQRMKSYRDGTYGRGLLYFLEPTIFTTNVLPAHWADPSMSLDNEAPSLVYGVDPSPVATSGGANLGLPITSAQYDLSGVAPQTVPTPDSSVFIPIPTGHTLFLGAFYSATGTGGVFATPVNGNGTLGTAVKLTEKPNSDTTVVTDQFSGDLRGVRLWVGRPDPTASTVTIAAMAGRLLDASDTVTYGPWIEQRRNLNPTPLISQSVSGWLIRPGITHSPVPGGREFTTTEPVAANAFLIGAPNGSAGIGDTVAFRVEVHNTSNQSLTLSTTVATGTAPAGPVVTIPAGASEVFQDSRLLNAAVFATRLTAGPGGVPAGVTFVVRDGWTTEKSPVVSDPFTGDTQGTNTTRYSWAGIENASESIYQTRTQEGSPAKQNKLESGPWVGGQGHSGCRFQGAPSYITNSPIQGGRIGFAASFIEVGSWIYG